VGDVTIMSSIFDSMKRDFADLIDEVETSCHDSNTHPSSSANPSTSTRTGTGTNPSTGSSSSSTATSGAGASPGTHPINSGSNISRQRNHKSVQSTRRRSSSILAYLEKVFWRTRTVDDDI